MPHFPIPSAYREEALRPAQIRNPQIKGKITPVPVDGQLSLSGVFATSLLKRDFNLETTAIIQNGKLGLTFRQLDEMSRRVARILGTKISFISSDGKEAPSNVDGDSVIVLISDGTLIDERTVVLILAILKLGATYLSIRLAKLESPEDWKWIIRQVQPLLVIMTDTARIPEMIRTTHVMCPLGLNKTKLPHSSWTAQALWEEALKLPFAESNDISVAPLRTRKPPVERPAGIFPFAAIPFRKTRLVKVGHRVILNRIAWEKSQFSPPEKEKLYLTYPISDPRSLAQVFLAILLGRSVHILDPIILIDPRVLMNEVKQWGINRVNLTPQQLDGLLDYIIEFGNKKHVTSVRYWMISGSNGGYFTYELGQKFFSVFPVDVQKTTLVVLYGVPEVLWAAAYYTCNNSKDLGKLKEYGGIYLGWPIHNTWIHIVDDKKYVDCPIGAKGEICINGGGLGDGGFAGSVSKFKSPEVFPTGDLGRIINDKNGNRVLVYDGSTFSRVKIGKRVVDLKHIGTTIVSKGFVNQCVLFTSPRARNSQRIVAAYVSHPAESTDLIFPNHILNDKFQEMEPSISASIELLLDIPTTDEGKVNYKELRRLYHYHLTDCDASEWEKLVPTDVDPKNLDFVKVLCKAVAASLGVKVNIIIEQLKSQKPFWNWKLGWTSTVALRCIEAVKSQGYNLAVEDFVATTRLDQLVDRMVAYRRHRAMWKKSIEEMRRKINYFDLTSKYWKDVTTLLKRDYESRLFGQSIVGLPRFWRVVMDELVLQSMCSVAVIQGRLVGVTMSFKSMINIEGPPPQLIQLTLQMIQEQIDNCRSLMPMNVKAAQSFYIAIDEDYATPAQRIMIARDLLIRNHEASLKVGCGGFILCTADPLVQEVATLLLNYTTLSEIPVNRYKTPGGFLKPFWDADDDKRLGVYFKDLTLPNNQSKKNLLNSSSKSLNKSKSKSITGVSKSRSKSIGKQ